jgi:AcrR family transcriptional regulator
MSTTRRSETATPRRQAIEAAVLTATAELLREGISYSDLNIERVATRAGLSRTAFYFYFRDKRDLLMRVTEGVTDLLFAEADRWWSGDGDGREEMTSALANVAALYEEHIPLLRAVVEAAAVDEEVGRFWRALVERFVQATCRRIEGEQAAGRVPADLPTRGVSFALCWMTERTIHQHLAPGEPSKRGAPLVESLTAVWLGAVYGRA